MKHLEGISDDDIAELNIPTGIPLVYELDENNVPTGPGRYLDPRPLPPVPPPWLRRARSSTRRRRGRMLTASAPFVCLVAPQA